MRTSLVKFIIAMGATALLYQNCSSVHESDASLSSFQACNLILKDQFSKGYHNFLQTNCASCHSSNGSGNGDFGDSSLDKAFDGFLVRGNGLVGERARDSNHQPPYTGPQHDVAIQQLNQGWNSAKQQADICIANAGITIDNGIEDGVVAEDPRPTEGTIRTYIKLINANVGGTTLTWDLGSQIASPASLSFPNAELEVTVSAITSSTGDRSYVISDPKLTAGDDSLHIIFIEFYVNNELVEGATSFHTVNRRVPAGEVRNIGVGGTIFPYNIRPTDTIALSIGYLEVIDFSPPSYNDLMAAGGVFQVNCMGCHDGGAANSTPQANFDISSYNQTDPTLLSVYDGNMVAPYSPNNSRIFVRMNDSQSPMPQDQGILPDAQLEQVLQWIQDGATECGFDANGDVEDNC